MLQAVHNPTVLKVSLSLMFFNIFSLMVSSIAVLRYLDLKANLFQVSLITTITGSMSILQIPLGILSDRFGRKFVLVMVQILNLIGMLIFVLATDPNYLILAALIAGPTDAGQIPIYLTMIADKTGQTSEERKETIGFFYTLVSIGLLVGPLTSSLLLQFSIANLQNIYQINLIYCIINLIFTVIMIKETKIESDITTTLSLSSRIKGLLKKHNIQAVLGICFLSTFFNGCITTYLPVYARNTLHFTDSEVASFATYRGLATLISRFFLMSFLAKFSTKKSLMGFTLCGGFTAFSMNLANNYLTTVLLVFIEGIGFGAMRIFESSIVAENATKETRGTGNGLSYVFQSSGTWLKMATAPIADAQGIQTVFMIGGGAAFLAFIPILLLQG